MTEKTMEKTPFSFEFDPAGMGMLGTDQDDGFRIGMMGEDGRPWDDVDVLFPDAEPRNQYEPLDPEKVPEVDAVKQDTPEYRARPAEERTRELFTNMRPHRMSLLGVISAASAPVSNERMEEVVEGLQQRKFSVYSTANLCTMLEVAGALDRVTEDGTPYSEVKPTPDIVVIDGEEYYQPSEPPAVHWLATDAGRLMVEENDPMARMREMLERDADLLPIYKQVLLLARDGTSMATFSEKVDANPAIAEPRRFFVQHFVEALERCEAVCWDNGRWVITPTGEDILDTLLANVEEAPVFEPSEKTMAHDGNVVPTETQGVNW